MSEAIARLRCLIDQNDEVVVTVRAVVAARASRTSRCDQARTRARASRPFAPAPDRASPDRVSSSSSVRERRLTCTCLSRVLRYVGFRLAAASPRRLTATKLQGVPIRSGRTLRQAIVRVRCTDPEIAASHPQEFHARASVRRPAIRAANDRAMNRDREFFRWTIPPRRFRASSMFRLFRRRAPRVRQAAS